MDLESLEYDAKLWLERDKDNHVVYIPDKHHAIRIRNNDDFHKRFEKVRNKFNILLTVNYWNNDKLVLLFRFRNEGEKQLVKVISFCGIRSYYYHNYYPWIEINNDNFQFCFLDEDNGPNYKSIGPLCNIDELFSVAKNEDLPVANPKFRDELVLYYDSLPLFKILSYMFGKPEPKEIIIEI